MADADFNDLPFAIETVPDKSGVMIVRVSGDIDISTVSSFKSRLRQIMDQGYTRLLLNLNRVNYIDSLGFGVIIGTLKKVRGLDGDMSVVCDQLHIRKLISITALDKLFGVYGSEQESLEKRFIPS
jgi:anti-sigma B factor antagonist